MAFFCNYRYKLLLYILSTSKIPIQFSPNKMYIYDETIESGKGRGVWFFSFFFFSLQFLQIAWACFWLVGLYYKSVQMFQLFCNLLSFGSSHFKSFFLPCSDWFQS